MAKRTAKKRVTKKRGATRTAKRTAKRTTRKKAPARKTTARKAPARKAPPRITGARGKARTKSEIFGIISEHVGITKKEVAEVFEVMSVMIAADLKKGNIGAFNVPGMMKVTVRRKPATKARKGINPFTGEPTIFKAKPARNVVKIRPLKGLKDMV
ncbi:MAG: HU family DNA-binding protein [Planctomycetota bacterium]|jgi:nucleoid DNA-binding protein